MAKCTFAYLHLHWFERSRICQMEFLMLIKLDAGRAARNKDQNEIRDPGESASFPKWQMTGRNKRSSPFVCFSEHRR